MYSLEKAIGIFNYFAATTLLDFLFYGMLAGGLWILFYEIRPAFFRTRKVVEKDPRQGQVAKEILQSVRSIVIFGFVTGLVVVFAYEGKTRLYLEVDRYGWTWFFASIILMIVIHDAYFYWTHRLMHHRWLYSWVHSTHHHSVSPTPWAAYSFSPVEAFVQAGIGPLIVFTLPTHPIAFGIFMSWQIAFNVFGHCGYEIFPGWFMKSRIDILLNTVTHHSLHHEKYRSNFGLYFNLWDRVMSTNDSVYVERFDLVTGEMKDETASF